MSSELSPTPVRVAATIPTRNRKNMLRQALAGLLAQTRPLDAVIVVDNASTDGTAEMVAAEFPSVRLMPMSENTGSAGGYAVGLREGVANGHDWVWLFNDDDVPTPDALEVMLGAVASLPDRTGLVGCGRDDAAGVPIGLGLRWENRHVPVAAPADTSGPPVALDVLPASGTLVAAPLVHELGVTKSEYFMMFEDTEYCLRARRAGWEVYVVPRVLATSRTVGSVGKSPPWRGYYQTRNQLAMTLEHRSLPELWWWAVRNVKLCAGAVLGGDRPAYRIRLRALGAWHGLRGVGGRRIEPFPPESVVSGAPGGDRLTDDVG